MVTIIKSNKCIDSDYTAMKTLKRLSKKAAIFCEKSGHDINKVKKLMNESKCFSLKKCLTKKDMDFYEVDYNYPYVIWNPYNIVID